MSHCKHPTCCQCGAVRDTPEHDVECPDAVVVRLMRQGRTSTTRKLIGGQTMIDSFNADHTGWARFSDDHRHRFRLARSLTTRPIEIEGGIVRADRGVTFVMLNPSTADAFTVDPTIRRCIGFAQDWGADVLQVVNLFSLRSTDPQALYAVENHCNLGDGHLNDGELLAACLSGARVIAAWGTHGAHRERGKAVRRRMAERFNVKLEHLGLTKERHPRHPLYLKSTTQPEAWAP